MSPLHLWGQSLAVILYLMTVYEEKGKVCGAKTAARVRVFLTLFPACAGTEPPFSGHSPWLAPCLPIPSCSHERRAWPLPQSLLLSLFLPQQSNRQVMEVVLSCEMDGEGMPVPTGRAGSLGFSGEKRQRRPRTPGKRRSRCTTRQTNSSIKPGG